MSVVEGPASSDSSVAERIELRRLQLGLSRRVLANLVGRSEEWLRLVETGRLRLDSVELIVRLARALRIEDFRDLIDWPIHQVRPRDRTADGLLRPLRSAIMDHPAIGGTGGGQRGPTVPTVDVADQVERCEIAWISPKQRYSQLAQQLPATLTLMRQWHWSSGGTEGTEYLIRLYHLCRELCSRAGAHDLAYVAADRAMLLANSINRSVVIAASAWQLSDALIHWGLAGDGHQYALAAAARLPCNGAGQADDVALQGALQLLAARTAAAAPEPVTAERFLAEAEQKAARLDAHRRVCGIRFGFDEVGLARMEAALACKDFDGVIRAAARTVLSDNCTAGQRGRFHIVAATAFIGRNDEMGAVFELTKAADSSDEDMRYDTDAHQTLRSLLRRNNRNRLLGGDLARLAHLAGMNGYAVSDAR